MLDEAALKQAEASLQALRRQVDAVNRERKLQQTAAGKELRQLEDQYYGAVRKNIEISLACSKVQEEVYRLRDALGETGAQQEQQGQQPPEGGGQQGQQQANGVADMDH
jgi:pre-mRNA-splicing factor SPF27